MTAVFADISAATYTRHRLHDPERDWPETNCYVDLWIEVIASLGGDPTAGLSFTVTQDFEGDQFTFFKFPPSDLEALFGASVQELAIFEDLVGHLETQVARGRLPLVEVDGYYLPDTRGVSYRSEHTKTTIGINRIDRSARTLDYFHNAGFFALAGDDFDGLFQRLPEQQGRADALAPYVEFVKFAEPTAPATLQTCLRHLDHHMRNRPPRNPIAAYRAHFADDVARLSRADAAAFHRYAFNTLRQLGANHELLADHLAWLQAAGADGFDGASAAARKISAAAKLLQFQLLRAVTRRKAVSDQPIVEMAELYDGMMRQIQSALAQQMSPATP
jgi:hypothetical protein